MKPVVAVSETVMERIRVEAAQRTIKTKRRITMREIVEDALNQYLDRQAA